MKIRIQADFVLDPTDISSRDAVTNVFQRIKSKLLALDTLEYSQVTIQRCYHDEVPPKPCEVMFQWKYGEP